MIGEVVAIVPAADEQERIDACLRALATARATVTVRARVVVVLDACTDRTAELVAGYPDVEVVVSAARCVGVARAMGTARARRTITAGDALWLAFTDADSVVPPDWFTRMIAYAEHGAELVLGTVVPGPELPPVLRGRWIAEHGSGDDHPHVHGANLGVRADVLTRIGGWSPLSTGEDVELVERATLAGLRIHRSGQIPVRTSARSDARAPQGFSSYLRALGAGVTTDRRSAPSAPPSAAAPRTRPAESPLR